MYFKLTQISRESQDQPETSDFIKRRKKKKASHEYKTLIQETIDAINQIRKTQGERKVKKRGEPTLSGLKNKLTAFIEKKDSPPSIMENSMRLEDVTAFVNEPTSGSQTARNQKPNFDEMARKSLPQNLDFYL